MRLSSMTAHVDPHRELQDLQEQYRKEVVKLTSYIIKGSRNRVKQLKRGEIEKVIKMEMVMAAHCGRWDLLENLEERHQKLLELKNDIEVEEAKDYEERFNPLNS